MVGLELSKDDLPINLGMKRREFLKVISIFTAGLIAGCAVNPVTGRHEFMLLSEEDEIKIDQEYSPLQISADYGTVQDKELNNYINQVGQNMALLTHRPKMPYSFRVVNAVYVNAYAFPGGSIACTRGILLSLRNEAELSALLGHELGHINARHTARQISKGMLTQALVGGLSILAGTQGAFYSRLASQIGSIAGGALLASYSRDNEREADALSMEYMVKAGYNPQGMVGLMDILRSMSRERPSIIEIMFATHPMSEERYQNAVEALKIKYHSYQQFPLYRERYMDKTVKLRAIKGAIEEMQKGEMELARERYLNAKEHFLRALKQAPEDYAGLVMMGTCELLQDRYHESIKYLQDAKAVFPQEARAYHLSGFAKLKIREFSGAYEDFCQWRRLLPQNPHSIFFKGLALEGMDNREGAAREYHAYLQIVREGKYAQYAYRRLVEWGYYRR